MDWEQGSIGFCIISLIYEASDSSNNFRIFPSSIVFSGDIKIISVNVPGCNISPCVIKRGTNATVTVEFMP